jgi:UMF1 family MFS transporter
MSNGMQSENMQGGTPWRGKASWALYDWANSPFTTLVITFVFAAYFSKGIVGDEVRGTELWGYAISISGLAIAILSPIFGAIADAGGPRKPWLLFFTGLCILGSFMLWFATPDPSSITWAICWLILANLGFEFGIVFNNAMLPGLVPEKRLGRWSGWAWGLGYMGGLAALVFALLGFVQTETPLFGLSKDGAEHVRVVGPIVAIWFALFAWPMFVFTPDRVVREIPYSERIKAGFSTLLATLRDIKNYKNVALFLVARMLYADGLATIFAFGGIYAAGTFGMTLADVILFGIILNVTAGLGAAGFAWLDDWFGSKKTIIISVLGLIVTASGAVMAQEVQAFWVWGSLLGIFVGPAQAASRSMLARIAPAEKITEFFGLYALTGKATAFIGPALVAAVTAGFESQRVGLSTVLIFFVSGLVLLMFVKEERA